MLSLFEGYLLILSALFAVNLGLFLGDLKLNNIKALVVAIASGILLILVNIVAAYFKDVFFFLTGNFGYLFMVMAIVLFILMYKYLKNNILKKITLVITLAFYITAFCLSSFMGEISIFNSLLLALFLIIITFVVYQLSKLLFYAKREYSMIVSEYMILESILMFILGLTYWSVKELDYDMFSSFLILTPTYQLVYVIIGIALVLIVGLYFNDRHFKKRY